MAEKRVRRSSLSFTAARIKALPAPDKGRVYHYDHKTPGLCVCVTQAGSKTFYFYRKVDGQPVRERLGKFPALSVDAARNAASDKSGQAARGENPATSRQKRQDQPTLQGLFDHWWERHSKPHKKTWADDKRIFDKYAGSLRTRRLAKITKADVLAWHTRLGKDHGPYQANRARALLSAMYGAADDLEYDGPNPCKGVKKFVEQSRERFLLPDEMRTFFTALAKEDPLWRDFFLLCLFTGGRRGNVAAMRWEEIDLAGGLWRITGKQMKNGQPMVVVLVEPAQAVLRSRLQAADDSGWVFPSHGRSGEGRIVDPRKAWARVVKNAKIKDLRMHDLRRSLGSWQAAAGASLAIIGKTLGHQDHKATQVYARLQLDPVRESVEQATAAMLTAGGQVLIEQPANPQRSQDS